MNETNYVFNTSTRVRAKDFREQWLRIRASEMSLNANDLHRKIWEVCSIAQVFKERCGMLKEHAAAAGFGVGREQMPSWLAAQGAYVFATDSPEENPSWEGQHAKSVNDLFRAEICNRKQFNECVQFCPVDMNQLDRVQGYVTRGHFDFVWSSGSFEHLGSIENGLKFFTESMRWLKPGGIAAHTTEMQTTFGSRLVSKDLVLYQMHEFDQLGERLHEQGDQLLPCDFFPGLELADNRVDAHPYGLPHLLVDVGGFTTTSVLLIAQRGER